MPIKTGLGAQLFFDQARLNQYLPSLVRVYRAKIDPAMLYDDEAIKHDFLEGKDLTSIGIKVRLMVSAFNEMLRQWFNPLRLNFRDHTPKQTCCLDEFTRHYPSWFTLELA